MSFQCTVVTPEKQALDETVTQVILPSHDGLVGILTGHAPMLVKLGAGPLQLDLAGGQRRYYFVEGGVAQIKDYRLTIITNQAIPADEIDVESARAEQAEATARQPTDDKSREERQRQIRSAAAKQAVAGRR
jgi:F-type H+-transporting ATPase subunit epsilon